MLRVTSRNARFQQWQALLANRNKRQRAREFLVHGVRPITIAAERGWPVRASTGSLFGVPAVQVPSHREVVAWAAERREQGCPLRIVGTDEHGAADLFDFDLTGPTLLLIGNETRGLSAAWREACDHMVRIPMTGTASSLNAASAATAVLYEAARQRIAAARRPGNDGAMGLGRSAPAEAYPAVRG